MNLRTRYLKYGVFSLAFLFFVSIFLFSSFASAKELKVGVVDVEKIYAGYEKAKQSFADFQKERKIKQDEFAKKQAELKKLQDEYAKQQKRKMKEDAQKEYEKKIADKTTELQNFAKITNEQLVKKNQAVTRQRLTEVAEAVQDYAKKKDFDLVINKKSLPYFSTVLNISDEIIKVLNTK